jgi:hypothetical protein
VDDTDLFVLELDFMMCRVHRDGVLSIGGCRKDTERERGN